MATLPPVSPAAFPCSDTIRNSACDSNCQTRFSTFLRAHRGAELVHDFTGRLNRRRVLIHIERDGADAGMTASAVALADLRQIDSRAPRAQGFEPTETFTRKLLLLSPTL